PRFTAPHFDRRVEDVASLVLRGLDRPAVWQRQAEPRATEQTVDREGAIVGDVGRTWILEGADEDRARLANDLIAHGHLQAWQRGRCAGLGQHLTGDGSTERTDHDQVVE